MNEYLLEWVVALKTEYFIIITTVQPIKKLEKRVYPAPGLNVCEQLLDAKQQRFLNLI